MVALGWRVFIFLTCHSVVMVCEKVGRTQKSLWLSFLLAFNMKCRHFRRGNPGVLSSRLTTPSDVQRACALAWACACVNDSAGSWASDVTSGVREMKPDGIRRKFTCFVLVTRHRRGVTSEGCTLRKEARRYRRPPRRHFRIFTPGAACSLQVSLPPSPVSQNDLQYKYTVNVWRWTYVPMNRKRIHHKDHPGTCDVW